MLDWFTGNGTYMARIHCMQEDWPWIILYAASMLGIVINYLVIATIWFKASRKTPPSPAKHAFNNLVAIFTLCAVTGYGANVIFLWWPAIRLQIIVAMLLNTVSLLFILSPWAEAMRDAMEFEAVGEKRIRDLEAQVDRFHLNMKAKTTDGKA